MTNSKKKPQIEPIAREDAPVGIDPNLRQRIKLYAEKHNFTISEFVDHKTKWSEEHEGRCFCDASRICPCEFVSEDMSRFNGRCLCNLFWQNKLNYENWKYYNNRPKKAQEKSNIMTDEEYKEAKKKVKKVLNF